MLSINTYYNYRTYVHELYKDGGIGSPLYNDLCSTILEIRDKDKSITSISIDISNYNISVELDSNATQEDSTRVINNITERILAFIINNKSIINRQLNPALGESISSFDEFLNMRRDTLTVLFCDISYIGNSITFNL